MGRAFLIVAWIGVVVTAAFLRFDGVDERSMHADEATGARIMAKRMEGQGGEFNPVHYHGPLLADLTMPVCRLRGESKWSELSKLSLRVVTATAGLLVVLVPLLWRRRMGDPAALAAGALLAVSPLLVYFSRMFIHESLLVLSGMALLGAVVRWPRWGLPGVLLGLMFAAKESFVISVLAWGGAVVLLLLEQRRLLSRQVCLEWAGRHGRDLTLSAAAALLTALICYTHGFTHWRGAIDAVRTFFIYAPVEGHDKPWDYYLRLLVVPQKSAGVWWYGTPVVVLALVAYAMSWGSRQGREQRLWIRFLAYGVVGHLLIYSIFSYKTPWLASLPWALTCWLGAMAFVNFSARPRWVQVILATLLAATLWSQWKQTRIACVRLHSDARNPFAYVPSRSDLEKMEEWLDKLRAMKGGPPLDRVAVVGSDYWPLPWYLRSFKHVGYWPQAPADLESYPLILLMTAEENLLGDRLKDSHVTFPKGLRDGVPIYMHLSRGVWDQWYNTP